MHELSVLILMTSYNGKTFLKEQIESIRAQTFNNWNLWIQDDGSTDGSWEIIESYSKSDGRIKITKNINMHGAYYNFHSLINRAKETRQYDYYLFCDHDDVWLPEKIELMIASLEQYNCRLPMMAYADMSIIDGQGEVKEKSIDKIFHIQFKRQLDIFYDHRVFGCNTIMNNLLFNLVPPVDVSGGSSVTGILSHDNYYAKYASVFGKLIYIPKITMYYRRYGTNVTSAQSYRCGIKRIVGRVLDLEKLASDHARIYSQSIYTIKSILNNDLPCKQKSNLTEIVDSLNDGGIKSAIIFLKYHITCGAAVRTISKLVILLSGKYKKYLET